MKVINGHTIMFAGQANGVRSGIIETITITELTTEQREYCRLLTIVNFHQLVCMGESIKQGMTFDQARMKYLKS